MKLLKHTNEVLFDSKYLIDDLVIIRNDLEVFLTSNCISAGQIETKIL